MGVRASPVPSHGYWALPIRASGWYSRIWAASLKHAPSLLYFSQPSSQRDRILLVSGKGEEDPPSTQLTTCPLSSFCTGKCYRNLNDINKNTTDTRLCHRSPVSLLTSSLHWTILRFSNLLSQGMIRSNLPVVTNALFWKESFYAYFSWSKYSRSRVFKSPDNMQLSPARFWFWNKL